MTPGNPRHRFLGIQIAGCVFTLAVLSQWLGIFQAIDADSQTFGARLLPPRHQQNHVLAVHVPSTVLSSGTPALLELIEKVDQYSPRHIAVVADGTIDEFLSLEQSNRRVRLDRLTVGFPIAALTAVTENAPTKFSTGFSDLPAQPDGIVRIGKTGLQLNGQIIPSLESAVARSTHSGAGSPMLMEYGISVGGPPKTVPHISGQSLMSGSAIRELIENRIVIIGSQPTAATQLPVASPAGIRMMDRLEVRANMIESLLQRSYTLPCPAWATCLLFAIITIASVQAAQHLPLKFFALVAATASILVWLGFLTTWWLVGIWLPVTAMILCALASIAAISTVRFFQIREFVEYWKVKSSVREVQFQSRFEHNVWQAIADTMSQMFQPTRIAMLELPPDATHLKIIKTAGCDYSQIFEKRLDYRRTPYFEAIESNLPIRNPRGAFFVLDPTVSEQEFILPITSGSATLGVIVLAMDIQVLNQWTDFESFLEEFNTGIAQLVAANRRDQNGKEAREQWHQRLQRLPEQDEFETVQNNFHLQNDLMERSDLAFDLSESAMGTFDVYGRMLRRNSRFHQTVQSVNLPVMQTTCVELMSALSGKSLDQCRRIFRQTIFENRNASVILADPQHRKSPRVMFVKPMDIQEDERRTLLETKGVLLEIVDGQPFEEIHQYNAGIADSIAPYAHRRLMLLDSAKQKLTSLSENGDPPQETLRALFGSVGSTIDEIVGVLKTCRSLANQQVSDDPADSFMIDTLAIWKKVVSGYRETLRTRSIHIVEDFSDIQRLTAVANPMLMPTVFEVILNILFENAFDESEIEVRVDLSDDLLTWMLTNRGGGTPIETLRKVIERSELDDSDPAAAASPRRNRYLTPKQTDQIAEIKAWANQWGGNVDVESLPQSLTIGMELMVDPVVAASLSRRKVSSNENQQPSAISATTLPSAGPTVSGNSVPLTTGG